MKRLEEIGQTACAITDHGNLYAGVSIYKLFKEHNIKYIHGCELYVCDNAKVKDKENRYYHLIVLCKNEAGRLNLNRLVTISNKKENFYYKPRIDFEILKEHSEGLIVCSACIAGEVSRALVDNDIQKAKEIAMRYKTLFEEDYYLEIQSHKTDEQIGLNKKLVSLSEELDIPLVVTCDAHHVYEEDRKYQTMYAFNGKYKEDGESYTDCFVQSEDEVRSRLDYLPSNITEKAINTTHLVTEKCNVELPLSAPIMPEMKTPAEYKNNREWLTALCVDGFKKKLNIDYHSPTHTKQEQVYIDRFDYEMDKLDRMGFLDYILLVHSYCSEAKKRGIARGSGGGSLVNYLSNITDIDPIIHDLYFERFIDVYALNDLESGKITKKELKIPDIDSDFSGADCKKVLKYLRDTYGETRVASIGRFGTNHTRGTIRDICKAMNIELATADLIAKSFGETQIEELDAIIETEGKAPEYLKTAYEFTITYSKLFEYVRKLSGLPKSFGIHPCGRVIATRDLDEFLPSSYDEDGVRFLQGDMHDVEDVGLVKIDLLGLRTITHEYDALEQSKAGEDFISPSQEMNDPKVFEIFNKGDTTGIFQFSSQGMKNTLKKMEVGTIDDLSVANALFRPGAMAYIDKFCDRRKGKEPTVYLHPDLEAVLKNTYGIMVFQEQLIQICRIVGVKNPDNVRKAVGKKDKKKLAAVKPELHAKLIERGWSEEQFEQFWNDILAFGNYSFNKSHSSAYSILAYMTAKLKAYYPAEFYSGLLNSYIGESNFIKDQSEEIFGDMAKHGILLKQFSFRNDHRRCSVEDGKIVYAIPLIRDLNQSVADALHEEREFQGTFSQLLGRLYERGVRESSFKKLIMLDFFSEYGSPKKLSEILATEEFFGWGSRKSIKKSSDKISKELMEIVAKHSTDTNQKGVVLQTYSNLDIPKILEEYETMLNNRQIAEVPIKVRVVYQKENVGLAPIPSGAEEDRSTLFVTDVRPLCRKSDGKQFGYSVFTTSFGSGKQSRFTVKGAAKKKFEEEPINPNDIIKCLEFKAEGIYWNLINWRQIYV